ncbi:MAG: AAA family ATPase [Kiritimatiellae bacterium]|nr:AAA family ATPase [Verrucomicrobiota bacterium]MBU4285348.1 AAA family ATPase [Verrucomicrobiota bacterium]MCG2659321.1 AAA family ATPase [Kiritimatiellia bacterium]
MYLEYWHFNKRPFDITSDPDFFFESKGHQEAITRISFAVETQKAIVLLTGDYGSGKTVVCDTVISRLPPEQFKVAFITNPRMDSIDLAREITFQFGEDIASRSSYDVLHALNVLLERFAATGKHCIVFIDEAHLILDSSILEDLRLLLNHQYQKKFIFTLMLAGQTELRDRLKLIPQMTQRIGMKFHIPNLQTDEVPQYIAHRLTVAGGRPDIFEKPAVDEIVKLCNGNPREVNALADLCLLIGSLTGKERIHQEEVLDAWKERT